MFLGMLQCNKYHFCELFFVYIQYYVLFIVKCYNIRVNVLIKLCFAAWTKYYITKNIDLFINTVTVCNSKAHDHIDSFLYVYKAIHFVCWVIDIL